MGGEGGEGEGGKGGGRFLVPCMLPDVSPQRLPVLKNGTVLRRSYFLPLGQVLPVGVMGRLQVFFTFIYYICIVLFL